MKEKIIVILIKNEKRKKMCESTAGFSLLSSSFGKKFK
jgi:hypothetical protein